MRGMSRSCCFTSGLVAIATPVRPSSVSTGPSRDAFAFAMMNDPARNLRPATSKSASAAVIGRSFRRKRMVMRLLSVVWSTTTTGPLPSMPPVARAGAVSLAMRCPKTVESEIVWITTLRMNWKVHPVSS